MKQWGSRALSVLVVYAFVLVPSIAEADHPWRIPNGYTNRVAALGGRCAVCHVSSSGGGTRTAFGDDFRDNGYTWNRELAEMDSDGDGWSNGQELGDPFGLWTAGSAANDPPPPNVPPYPSTYLSNPGVRSNEPSDSVNHPCSSAERHDCDSNATCASTSGNDIGDWSCTCNAGYEPTARNGHTRSNAHDFTEGVNGNELYNILSSSPGCQEIDCNPNPCGVGTCSDDAPPGTYTCTCPQGYDFTGGTCEDVDECLGSPCDTNATCNNTDGSFTCTCNMYWEGSGFVCTDIDECLTSPCNPDMMCVNQIGGPRTCVPIPDAGVPDAGVPDAGLPDAGVPDAGAFDAGSSDATGPDAAGPDAAGGAGDDEGGCGCRGSSSSSSAMAWGLLVALLFVRRRRRAPAQ